MSNKEQILKLVETYSDNTHSKFYLKDFFDTTGFEPGKDIVPYAGRVFSADEVTSACSSLLDFWLTLGENGLNFEKSFSDYIGSNKSILTNSGSSANLLALSALTSYKLEDRRLLRGDEVITVAAGFPTTVAPIIQNGLVAVFADNDPETLNIKIEDLENLVSERTKAVFVAHTLGNPFNLSAILEFCQKHNLYLIEDNCDSLGSTYDGKLTGSFGTLSTQSFYPPHHLTLGEGGMINVNDKPLYSRLVESFRDWGRDCWCPSGKDNTCGKRYEFQLGDLPEGYDHKFTYSHWGYNIKPLDIQAAIGIAQLKKLPLFSAARIRNWNYLRNALAKYDDKLYFSKPTHADGWDYETSSHVFKNDSQQTNPSWFGFMIGVKPNASFTKQELARYLDSKGIHNRMLFGGNLLRQPVVQQQIKDYPDSVKLKSDGDYSGADSIMNNSLFVGTYPGLRKVHLDYIAECIGEYLNENN